MNENKGKIIADLVAGLKPYTVICVYIIEMAQITNLKTVKNYAQQHGVTTSYIYKLIGQERIRPVIIDGMKFIDEFDHPSISSL